MLGYINNIRTFICPNLGSEAFFNTCLSKCKSLRVLNLLRSSLEVLPYSIGTLKQLRFLNLSESKRIKKLPNSLCKLHGLQCLDLSGCNELEELPKDMKYMISLRVLALTTKQKSLSETGIECLKSLRTLELKDCKNLEYLFAGMECPPCSQNFGDSLETLPRGMKRLTSLKKLCLCDCESLNLTVEEENDKDQLSGSKLEKLAIDGLPKLTTLPKWLLQWSMLSLETLWILNCQQLKTLPAVIQSLTSLKSLYIISCPLLIESCKTGENFHRTAHVEKRMISDTNLPFPFRPQTTLCPTTNTPAQW
ncbi:hypothetical protein ACFE04_012720 [Oxalis oulophora]